MRIRCCLTLIVLLTSQILSIAAVDQAKFQVPISHPVVAAEKLLPHLLPSTQRQVASVRSSPNSAVITLTPTGFEPATLTITAGTAVTWHNTTTVTHTLQSGSASGFFKVFLPLILKDGSRVNGQVPDTALGSESFSATLLPGGTFVHLFTTVGEYAYFLATAPQLRGRVIVQEDHVVLPSNPADVALPLDLRTVTNLATATEFLYSGTNPIQTGVAPGTIQARRVAVLRGRVLTHSGAPLPGVTITILNHPEFGQTLSRADGMFDLAVNGGERLTVVYQKGGYLSAQRQVETPWQDYAWLEEIRLIPPDAAVTLIDLTATTPMQIARGSVISDADGVRQATLFFPQGVTATMAFSDGTKQPLNVLHVRATEYTVGAGGSESMPARLPSATGYTYAAEFNADEAVAADASEIAFSRPLPLYLENFLDFPVGSPVPVGSYNRDQDKWAASADGQVVKILSITSDMADLDIDGNGHPASAAALAALGITDTERRYLAHLYRPNQGLWRIPVAHFTSPWDFNWPFGPPPDAQSPNQSPPEQRKLLDDSCIQSGSIIECQNQVLGEAVGLTGTPFSLHYQSDRMAGFRVADTLKISLSGPHLPASLARIALEIDVAGRQVSQNFPASPNQHTVFAWDGKDAYGRIVQGRQPIAVRIGYVYHGVYLRPSERPDTQYDALFGHFSYYGTPATGDPARGEVTLWQLWHGSIGAWDALPQGLGGWSLDLQHAYDPIRRVLYYGDGRHRQAENLNSIITTVAGNGIPGVTRDGVPATATSLNRPYGNNLAVGPDGSIYIPDRDNHQIRRVRPDGIISTVAGTGVQGFSGDGAPAIAARLNYPESVALGPDGSLYIADVFNHCVRRVGTDGIITTVAGTTTPGFGGDGGLATQAQLNTPDSVILGTDGSLYISDNRNNRVRRVGPDGIISTVAGGGTPANGVGDGGPALQARLNLQWGLAFGPDGSLYIADTSNHRIRRVGPDGVIQTVAGTDQQGSGGDGGPATQAQLSFPSAVAVGPDGSLYIVDLGNNRIRQVGPDNIISTVAGGGAPADSAGDGGPATAARLAAPRGIALGPDGSVYIADTENHRILRVTSAMPGFMLGDVVISSEDASELYVFNSRGRHLRTLNALTGAIRYNFTYDTAGRLVTVTDGDGNRTTIERDDAGKPIAIVGPYRQRTELVLNVDGYLSSITNPASERVSLTYVAGGLLATLTDPRGNIQRFSYDNDGRLMQDKDAVGGFISLARTEQSQAYTITLTSALSRTMTYRVEHLGTGVERRVNTDPAGTQSQLQIGTNGNRQVDDTAGTTMSLQAGPDPRWGMPAAVPVSTTITAPDGLAASLMLSRTATLADANNPLSLVTLTDTLTINHAPHPYTWRYDTASRAFTESTPQQRQSITTIDAQGRVVREQAGDLLPASYSYDSRGRVISATLGSGSEARVTIFSYNSHGELATITDPLGRTTGFDYDAAGRVITQTLPDGRQIHYNYDANGNVTTIAPPGRPAHSFAYTPINLPAAYTPPNVGSGANQTRYSYNVDRLLTRITRPDGQSVDFGYDSAGRLSTLNLARGLMNYSYYPTTGQLVTLTSPGGITLTYSYNGSLLTNTIWTGPIAGSVSQGYDNNFRVTSLSINNSQNTMFQYDNDGLLIHAGDLTLSRNPQNGLLTGTTLGNVNDAWNYNGFGELLGYSATYNSANIFALHYTRDKLGRITTKSETVGGTTNVYSYTYDLAGRLAEVRQNGATVAAYTYDDNGNRLSYSSPGGTINGVYDDQDRLLKYGTSVYTYTANGELLSKTSGAQTTMYQYDELGNLMAVSLPNGTQIEYLVDGQNRRIGKQMNGVLVQGFLYQNQIEPIAELDGAGKIVSRFIYAGRDNVPDYIVKAGVVYRIIADHLGSPRLVVNVATGQIVQRIDYDEFGNVIADTNPGFQPFGFAGGIYDIHTKLTRFGARDYDAEAGRWTLKDPILFLARGTNLFDYALGDGVNYNDPDGFDVYLCKRPARIDNGLLRFLGMIRIIDKNHWWIKTDEHQFGVTNAPGAPDVNGTPTIQSDQSNNSQATCTRVNSVNEQCVNGFYSPGSSTGPWKWNNNCQTFALSVLITCGLPREDLVEIVLKRDFPSWAQ